MAKEDHIKHGEIGKSEGAKAGMKMEMPMSAALRATTTQKVGWALLYLQP